MQLTLVILVQNTASCLVQSFTRAINGGGYVISYFSTINSFNYDSLGDSVDFGYLI